MQIGIVKNVSITVQTSHLSESKLLTVQSAWQIPLSLIKESHTSTQTFSNEINLYTKHSEQFEPTPNVQFLAHVFVF